MVAPPDGCRSWAESTAMITRIARRTGVEPSGRTVSRSRGLEDSLDGGHGRGSVRRVGVRADGVRELLRHGGASDDDLDSIHDVRAPELLDGLPHGPHGRGE